MKKKINNNNSGEFVVPPPSFTRTRKQVHQNCRYYNFCHFPILSQPFLGCQLGFHIDRGCTLFSQLGCFGLDITFIVFVYSKFAYGQLWGFFLAVFFSLLQEGETICITVVELNIQFFI